VSAGCDLGELSVDVQRRLEALYELDRQPPVADFMIPPEEARDLPGGGSRTLLSEAGDALEVAVVLAPQVAEGLRTRDPRVRIDDINLGPFCALIEEVSHFVFLLFCAQTARSVTQLELELQGEVDKYLNVAFLLSLQNEGAVSRGLKALLFRQYHLRTGLSEEQAERYHAASGFAYRYCAYLESEFLQPARLGDLRREARRFYRLGQSGKLERISTRRLSASATG
jgi:hypothetical protein